jgi:hypothetical protein
MAASSAGPSQPVSDEALRLIALPTIFPGAQVAIESGKRVKYARQEKPKAGELFFPDAFVDEKVYSVTGGATNEAEMEASRDVVTQRYSNTRHVKIRLFRWPRENGAGLLAVLQYDFPGANPAMCCLSIGRLVHLVRDAEKWEVRSQYLLESAHHSSLQKCELLDLIGDGVDELVVESDWGGAGTAGSSLQVFDLSHGSFEEVLNTQSRLEYMDLDRFTQVLNIGRTRQSNGRQVCVSKTTMFEGGKPFEPPRITYPCYNRGYGIDAEDVKARNELLAPLR